ncbi:MAG: hypothetical protein IEMM0006_1898 [bacterium]|nr:MAG: hypothetical protein IEMM0006_1898 [bacterium]
MRAKIIKVTSFISLTLVPGIYFYWDYWGKLKTEQMNIFEYYSENLHTLLFMSVF